MNFNLIMGIDIAKKTLDCTLIKNGESLLYKTITNNPRDIRKLITEVHSKSEKAYGDILFVMEFTGHYNNNIILELEKGGIPIWQVSALHIIRSSGLLRGKNDQIDSLRIAMFAYRNMDQYRIHVPVRQELIEIKRLFAVRRNLVKSKSQISALTKDYDFLNPKLVSAEKSPLSNAILALAEQIAAIEEEMKLRVLNDSILCRLFVIITSIKGISFVTAIKIIIATNEFKKLSSPKALACHAGVAPFGHSSGTSINKKPSVSHMADKELKKLLHMAAIAAITHSDEMKKYYLRKVEQGKHKMTVINNVRNKLIHRIYACVNNDRIYQKNYDRNLV